MIIPPYKELVGEGFKTIQPGKDFPGYLGKEDSNIWILAKHLIDDRYEIHFAKDSQGNTFDSTELNCSGRFEKIKTLESQQAFLKNPDYSLLEAA